MKMNQKNLPLIIGAVVIVLLVIGGGVFAYTKMNKKAEAPKEETRKKKVIEPVNVLPTDQRPYIQIMPQDANNLQIVVKSIKKPATEMEYTFEYNALFEGSTIIQATGDTIALSSLPAQKKVFLGSCSAGGACTLHKEVSGGSILARFKGDENYVLQSDWRFIQNKDKASAIGSKDAKFQMESPAFKTQSYIVVYNTPGYPEGLKGSAVSDPYSLTTAGALTGNSKLTMRANEEGTLAIMGWDGTKWQEFAGTVEGKSITADVPLMELYIVVKK